MLNSYKKFLVIDNAWSCEYKSFVDIEHYYLVSDAKSNIKVTRMGSSFKMVIKDYSDNEGYFQENILDISRYMFQLSVKRSNFYIKKTKYYLSLFSGFECEIDYFHDNNKGLVLASLSNSIYENYELPNFIGEEVTDISKYSEIKLSRN